ncbi:MAG: hypothetical protein CAK89_00025 [Opitutia bacterium AMD-G3]|nr:MAG: hypothetical protein CAK89_00025 [Opitutae bacterium AMD-G3]
MRRTYLFAAVLCALVSAACFLVFQATPATLDAQGFLHEPFGLLPVGWLFGFVGALLLLLAMLRRQ